MQPEQARWTVLSVGLLAAVTVREEHLAIAVEKVSRTKLAEIIREWLRVPGRNAAVGCQANVLQHERAANFLSLNKLHPLAVTRTVGVFKNACIPFIVERNTPSIFVRCNVAAVLRKDP
jgi:hypothetical protein